MAESMTALQVGSIPVLGRPGVLDSKRPLVIVLHGMSTTPETLAEGWPPTDSDGFDRLYWRLPVLREGREAVRARRDRDLFLELFAAVWSEVRAELSTLLASIGDRPVGLFGFSIGTFLSLWGAVDHPNLRAVAGVGGVPNFDYLLAYYPDYPWDQEAVAAVRRASNLLARLDAVSAVPSLILHGEHDDVARWEWMAPLAEALATRDASAHPYQVYPHLRHRLVPEGPDEARDVADVRQVTAAWFTRWLEA